MQICLLIHYIKKIHNNRRKWEETFCGAFSFSQINESPADTRNGFQDFVSWTL